MPKVTTAATDWLNQAASKDPRVKVKKLFGQPAAFVNGKMCFGTFGEEIVLRLSPEDLEKVGALPGSHPFEPMAGRAMKGYVALPVSALSDPKESARWVAKAVRWTETLSSK